MDAIVKTGEVTNEMTPIDHIKMMQAPEAFGVAFGQSKPDSKAFKDFRYKAELDSLHKNLSDLISSSTLNISKKMLEVSRAYYNSWRHAAENTKHKREMKRFFLNLYLGILNTASCHNKVDKNKNNDKLWQELSNNIALIIGEEQTQEDTSLYYRLPPSEGLRMKYRVTGFD